MTEPDRYGLRPLLEQVLAGDEEAYNQLLARLRPFLHARVRQLLGPRPGSLDASNLVQSALRRIHANFHERLADDPTVTHLLAWIKTILRNRVIDELRRLRPDPLARPGGPASEVPDPPSSNDDVQER